MIQSVIVLFLSLSALMGGVPHPFHVSHTDIRFNEESKRFEIVSRVFVDDMELAVSNWSETKYSYDSEENSSIDTLLRNYYFHHFSIQEREGDQLELNYLGAELSKDFSSIWIYSESDSIVVSNMDVLIRNALVMESYDDQKNILSLECMEDIHYLLFQTPRQQEELSLGFRKK